MAEIQVQSHGELTKFVQETPKHPYGKAEFRAIGYLNNKTGEYAPFWLKGLINIMSALNLVSLNKPAADYFDKATTPRTEISANGRHLP